jgi:hypothetical protein
MLLRGTPLYDSKDKLGLVESHDIASPFIPRVQEGVIPHVVQSASFDYAEWKKMAELAEWLQTHYNCRARPTQAAAAAAASTALYQQP